MAIPAAVCLCALGILYCLFAFLPNEVFIDLLVSIDA